MREILILKPQMKTWLNLQYFIKKGHGLLNKKQTDFESKQQGLASPMRFALDLLWVPFAASMAMDTVFFSCKCLKSCKDCAAACQTDVFVAWNGGCRGTTWQWQRIVQWWTIPSAALSQDDDVGHHLVIFPQKHTQGISWGVLFGTYTNILKE